jgi:hypothetical protein
VEDLAGETVRHASPVLPAIFAATNGNGIRVVGILVGPPVEISSEIYYI